MQTFFGSHKPRRQFISLNAVVVFILALFYVIAVFSLVHFFWNVYDQFGSGWSTFSWKCDNNNEFIELRLNSQTFVSCMKRYKK